jgi:predicted RND superfamily exporter protein
VVIEEEKIARFSGKMPDLGSHLINIKNDSLQIFLKKSGLDKKFTCHVTGSAHLMELNNFNIANNVYYGLWFSCLIIALIIGFMFKSVKMAIIGTIPNVLPLLFVGALMGITGVNIKISTSILFILSFGIAVDDTIHYMSSFRLDRKKFPNDLVGALRQTFLTSGKSIIVTSLILSAGFFTLVFSSFGGTYHIGLFTSICLVVALLADLMLLPVLIYYFGKDFVSTDSKEEQSQ